MKKTVIGIIVATTLNTLAISSAFAWGPERATFTMETPATYPTFNSITNNPTIGDERDFVRVGEINADVTKLKNEVEIEPGKKYLVYIYYHNNASATFNAAEYDRSGVAFGTKMSSSFPETVTPDSKGKITGTVSANNSNPKSVWDEAYLTLNEGKVKLKYVTGSAKIYNDWGVNGSVLSTNLFTQGGTYLGLNELDGVILGCEEYHGIVTYQLLAEKIEDPIPEDPEPEDPEDPEEPEVPEDPEEPTCITNPEMEGCSEIPETGPLEIVMAIIIILGICGGIYYYVRTQKALDKVTKKATDQYSSDSENKDTGIKDSDSDKSDNSEKDS